MPMIIELPSRTMLLIDLSDMVLYPFSSTGLKRGSGSRHKIVSRNTDEYIFDSDGTIRKIENISILGPSGENSIQKFLCFITGNWNIHTELSEPLLLSLDSIKEMILSCIENSVEMDREWLATIDSIKPMKKKILTSIDSIDLFNSLLLPSPENALDML